MKINKILMLQIAALTTVIVLINVPTAQAQKWTTINFNQVHIKNTTLVDMSTGQTVGDEVPLSAKCYAPEDADSTDTKTGETGADGTVNYVGDSYLEAQGDPEAGIYTRAWRKGKWGECTIGVNVEEDPDDAEPGSDYDGADDKWKGTISRDGIIRYEGWEDDDPEDIITKFQGLKGSESYHSGWGYGHWFGWIIVGVIVLILAILTGGKILGPIIGGALGAKGGASLAAIMTAALGVKVGKIVGAIVGAMVTLWAGLKGAAAFFHCGTQSLIGAIPGVDWDGCKMDRYIENAVIALEHSGPGDQAHDITAEIKEIEDPRVGADKIITSVKEMNKNYLNEYLISKGLEEEEITEIIHVADYGGDYSNCEISPNYGYVDGNTNRPLEGSLKVVNSTLNESTILPNETYRFTIENEPFNDEGFEIIAQKLTENTDRDTLEEQIEREAKLGNVRGPCISSRQSTPLTYRILNEDMEPSSSLSVGEKYTPSIIYEGEHAGYWEQQDQNLYCAEGDKLVDGEPDSYLIPKEFWDGEAEHIDAVEEDAEGVCEVSSENFVNRMTPCGQGKAAPIGHACADWEDKKACSIGSVYLPETGKCHTTFER